MIKKTDVGTTLTIDYERVGKLTMDGIAPIYAARLYIDAFFTDPTMVTIKRINYYEEGKVVNIISGLNRHLPSTGSNRHNTKTLR